MNSNQIGIMVIAKEELKDVDEEPVGSCKNPEKEADDVPDLDSFDGACEYNTAIIGDSSCSGAFSCR